MARKQNRLGVRSDQVDIYGRPISPVFFQNLVNDLPAWTDLPSYVGGTEQLLPVNDDEPDTSPILCDIQYPDTLRNDQYFTYRESPTTKDGLAKIRGIRGNTLVWNQLVQNGNFADNTKWTVVSSATINSVTNNTINVTTASTAQSGISNSNVHMIKGHKYLLIGTVKTTGQTYISISGVGGILFTENSFNTKSNIFTWASATQTWAVMIRNWDANSATFEAKNVMCFDLTAMGLDSLTVDQFKSLFPLNYYAYNSGSLLNFNGTGIKTTEKNLMNADDVQVGKAWNNASNSARATTFISVQPNTQYTLSYQSLNGLEQVFAAQINSIGGSTVGNVSFSNNKSVFTTASDCYYIAVQGNKTNITKADYVGCNFQLELGSSATSYEPYTSSTLSLPISTYFPTGMKNAGSVYDELTPTRAITRIGAVDLGSLDWLYNSSQARFYVGILEMKNNAKLKCAMYETVEWNDGNGSNMGMYCSISSPIVSFWNSSYSDPDVFKSAMSGVYLFYELATPVVEATMSFE